MTSWAVNDFPLPYSNYSTINNVELTQSGFKDNYFRAKKPVLCCIIKILIWDRDWLNVEFQRAEDCQSCTMIQTIEFCLIRGFFCRNRNSEIYTFVYSDSTFMIKNCRKWRIWTPPNRFSSSKAFKFKSVNSKADALSFKMIHFTWV